MEPHILVFDTETTGIPNNFNLQANKNNIDNWNNARVLQVAWLIINKDNQTVSEFNSIVKPYGNFVITPTNQRIHGLTQEFVINNGITICDVIYQLKCDISKYNVCTLVAHNFNFDKNVLLSEIYRAQSNFDNAVGQYVDIFNIQSFCTMIEGSKIMPTRKWPKLSILCHQLNISFDTNSAHEALYDTTKTAQCYAKLI